MATRVLFLNTRDRCGADVAVHLMLMRHFASDEAEVYVLSNSEAADADEMRAVFAQIPGVHADFMPFGRPVDDLAGKSNPRKALAYAPTAVSLGRAAAFIHRHHVEVLHATDRPRDASFVTILGRLTGTASVIHMHSSPGPHLTRPTLWGFSKTTAIFAVSDFIRDALAQMGFSSDKIHTVHNATDVSQYDPDFSAGVGAAVRERFGIPAGAPLAGIIARMNPWKGQRESIGAAAILRASYPDLHLLIVGAPVAEEQAEYEAIASAGGIGDRLHFAGFHKDVRPFLDAFDLFVHPSFEEPFGLAITEAMAMRKPVIACASGGVTEIITHGEDGWLVEPHSAQSVAAGISTLLADPAQARRLGERARATVRDRFSPRRQCALVAKQYADLVGDRRPGSRVKQRMDQSND